jgi:polysaccharide export outer membrane protein
LRTLLGMWLTVGLSAWASDQAVVVAAEGAEGGAVTAPARDGEYRLGRGDALFVQVYEEPSLSGEVVVSDACSVSLGLIGQVDVCGRLVSEVEREIVNRYDGAYLVHPTVAVKVTRFHSQRVDVLGEVAKPGPQYMEGPTTLVEVISLAGGPRAENVVRATVVRRDGSEQIYDLTRMPAAPVLLAEGDQIILLPGDVVYVEGQVDRPGAITLNAGLTVTQALALAGGTTDYANLRRVLVNRAEGEKVLLNVLRVQRGLSDDVELQSDDHVIVPRGAF